MKEQAFPRPSVMRAPGLVEERGFEGMSLRDYFAAHALAFLRHHEDDGAYPGLLPTITARNAYLIADAMLKERAKV